MNWLLLLHIATMLCWCGSLLYLPVVLSGSGTQNNTSEPDNRIAIAQWIFTFFLTPLALIAIISGTLIFVVANITALWLMIKLSLVTALVLCHAVNGWLIVKIKTIPSTYVNGVCSLLGLVSVLLMIAIISIVLAKPSLDFLTR